MTVTDATPVTSPEAGTVEIERTGEHHDIAVLTLRRERKLNALSTHLESVLLDALRSQEVRTSRAVVVTGVPRAFPAGADTGELREMTPEAVWIVALVTYIGYTAFNQVLVGSAMDHLADTPPSVSYIAYAVIGIVLAVVHLRLRPLPPSSADGGVRSSFWWTYLGAGFGGAWMMLVGAVAAGLFPKLGLVDAVVSAGDQLFSGFGVVLLLLSVIPLFTIGTLNFYGGSLTLLSSIDSVKRIPLALGTRIATLVVLGVVSTALAFSADDDFLTTFGDFLIVLGYLFTPWTAVNLIDFCVVRRGRYSIREIFNPLGIYGRWNWRGLTAYGVGFVSILPFAVIGDAEGPLAHWVKGTDVTMLVGLAVSSPPHLVLCRSLDIDAERASSRPPTPVSTRTTPGTTHDRSRTNDLVPYASFDSPARRKGMDDPCHPSQRLLVIYITGNISAPL